MRAELTTTSYLTGAVAVSLAFPPNPPPAKISIEGDAVVFPTMGGGLDNLLSSATEIMAKVNAIPFDQIGSNANTLLGTLNSTVGGPELKQVLTSASGTMVDLQGLIKRTDAGLTPLMKRLPDISNDLQQTLAPDAGRMRRLGIACCRNRG